ncbi:ATP-binding protein [Anaerosalibacter bizertensis]|uniref:ATP-binding protein n=1 Tax=Anaerosalibacter bizertensis TaxID=932217 RepID=UPI002DDB619D|nr:ATP-binding protein [Anaerosalibacter bizertensis]
MIEIIDQGEGFSKKMLKDGKNQLLMGKESRKRNGHHGLGLYIADTIIKKHNGELILSNSVNGGGKVIVKIPLLYK